MVDDWLLEHVAKVTALSCVLIVIYFLFYSIWRITQMPNNPWNWNEWNWPLGGRHAIEIVRKPTEMPFTLSLEDRHKEDKNKITLILNYIKDRDPPNVTVMWGPTTSFLMRAINAPWCELNETLMISNLEPNQWKVFSSADNMSGTGHEYFILQRVQVLGDHSSNGKVRSVDRVLSESYDNTELVITPPVDFEWSLLKNQYRYPAAVFATRVNSDPDVHHDDGYTINGVIQILHVKNDVFPKPSTTLAQYIKMNNGQCHILQWLYVMDDAHTEDEDVKDTDVSTEHSEEPFHDVLCSVCQVSPVSRVIIPCRHVCLCTSCFEKVESCPICRGTILYFFKTRTDTTNSTNTEFHEEPRQLNLRQRMQALNDRFNAAVGITHE